MARARRVTLAFLLLSNATASAQDPREFGAATFVPPAGWTLDSRPNMQTYGWVRGRDRCLLIISAAEQSPNALDQAFSAAWSALFANNSFQRADRPRSVERTSPAGFRHAVGEGQIVDAAGNSLLARLHVFPLGATSQWVVLIGNGAQALAACRDDWNSFFASLRFRSSVAEAPSSGAPRPAAPPAPATRTERPAPSGPGEVLTGPQQFDNITFVAPKRWTVRRSSGLVQLTPLALRPEEKLDVLLLPGRVSSADLIREVEATWVEVRSLLNAEQMMTVNGRPYDLDETAQTLKGVQYVKADGGLKVGGRQTTVLVYAFRAGNRVERAVVASRDFNHELTNYTPANRTDYNYDIRQLLFTMKFANQSERPLPPAGLRPGGVVGVWDGLAMSFGEIKEHMAIFFDNGLVYFGPQFPMRGLLDIDANVEQPAKQRYWGTYTWSSGTGVITMPYGKIPVRSVGAGLVLTTNRTDHRYIRLMMPQSPRLDGTWCARERGCLRLTSDGRFEDTGAVKFADGEIYPFSETPAQGSGQYILRDHTLVLAYDRGPEIRLGFVGVEDPRSTSPNVIRLGFALRTLQRQ